jgi:PcfJ-like protein
MGKRTKSREAQRLAAEHTISARLQQRSRARHRPGFINSICEFGSDYRAKIETYRTYALRAPEQWRCGLRKRTPELRFLELVKFTFARYPIARHLENSWIAEPDVLERPNDPEQPDFRLWYIVAAQGGSLYQHAARSYMTRIETHHFLNAPDGILTTRQAFWYAFARSQTGDPRVAFKIARTKITTYPVRSLFWTDVARYFARNPSPILEMNDLIDFFDAAKAEDATFGLSGRTLPALRRRMEEWHRSLRKGAVTGGERWSGSPLSDAAYRMGSGQNPVVWRFHQIKTSCELFREGELMQHCVMTYKTRCMGGYSSIWSLSCEYPRGQMKPSLTIEINHHGKGAQHCGDVVQCRGFSNRLPTTIELAIIKRWATDHELSCLRMS